jgi:hypothetical protein
MKNVKFLLVSTVAVFFAFSAIAADKTVDFSGGANVRLGFVQQNEFAAASGEATTFAGLANETAANLNANVTAGKLTAKIGYNAKSTGVGVENAWLKYSFNDTMYLMYKKGSNNHWSTDVKGFADGGQDSLKFSAMGAFVVLWSNDSTTTPVKYTNTDYRLLPLTQIGYELSNDMMDLTAGVALDVAKEDFQGEAYTGYLLFLKFAYKLAGMGKAGLEGAYASNASNIMGTPDFGTAVDKADNLMGARVFFEYTGMATFTITPEFRYSMETMDEADDSTTMMYGKIAVKKALDDNFAITGAAYLDRSQTGDADAAQEIGAYIDFGYSF